MMLGRWQKYEEWARSKSKKKPSWLLVLRAIPRIRFAAPWLADWLTDGRLTRWYQTDVLYCTRGTRHMQLLKSGGLRCHICFVWRSAVLPCLGDP